MGNNSSACLEAQVIPSHVLYPDKVFKIGDKYCSIYSCVGKNIKDIKKYNACYDNGEFEVVGRCNINGCCYNLNNNGISYYTGDCLSEGVCQLKYGGDSLICELVRYKGDNTLCAIKSTLDQLRYGHIYNNESGKYVSCNPEYIKGGANYFSEMNKYCSISANLVNEACIKFYKLGMKKKGIDAVNDNNIIVIVMLIVLVVIIYIKKRFI